MSNTFMFINNQLQYIHLWSSSTQTHKWTMSLNHALFLTMISKWFYKTLLNIQAFTIEPTHLGRELVSLLQLQMFSVSTVGHFTSSAWNKRSEDDCCTCLMSSFLLSFINSSLRTSPPLSSAVSSHPLRFLQIIMCPSQTYRKGGREGQRESIKSLGK